MKHYRLLFQIVSILLAVLISSCSKDKEINPDQHQIEISEINPTGGVAGTNVTILGSGFGKEITDNIVKFNNKAAVVVTASENVLIAEVPEGAGTGPITVQMGKTTATGPIFTFMTEPEATKTYYMKFKANNVWKLFEVNGPGYQSCGECACMDLPPLSSVRYSTIYICKSSNNWVLASDIIGWDKKTINFQTGQGYPIAEFYYLEGGKQYFSQNVDNQANSWIKISKVEEDGQIYLSKAFKVTGTFQCKVALEDEPEIAITEGSFVIRLTEDY